MADKAGATNTAVPKAAKKWSGGVHVVLDCDLDAAWNLQSDFLGLMRWASNVTECYLLEGEPNAVGCVRFVTDSKTYWNHERLLELDNDSYYMSYDIEENHFIFPHGYQGYVAKIRMGEAGEGQCWVNWTYEVYPVQTQTQEGITKFMDKTQKGYLKQLEEAAQKLSAQKNDSAADQSSVHKLPAPQPAHVFCRSNSSKTKSAHFPKFPTASQSSIFFACIPFANVMKLLPTWSWYWERYFYQELK